MSQDYYSPHPRLRLGRHFVISGLPGADVAAVGRGLSASLGLAFTEVERLTESIAGRTRAAIAVEDGDDALQRADAAALARALRSRPPGILTVEAAFPLEQGAQRALRTMSHVVHVRRGPEDLLARIRAGRERAPARFPEFLLVAPDSVAELQPVLDRYTSVPGCADVVFEATGLHSQRVADALRADLEALAEA